MRFGSAGVGLVLHFNLLPHRESLRKFKQDQFHASILVTLLLAVLTSFAIYLYLITAADGQNNNIAVLEKEIKRLELQIIEVKELNTHIDSLLTRQKALEAIQADRNGPVRLLSEVANTLPQGVVLTKLAQKEQELTLEGIGQTNENLSKFLDNLGTTGAWFSKPELLFSEAQNLNSTGKLPLQAFKFSVKVLLLPAQEPSGSSTRTSQTVAPSMVIKALPSQAVSNAQP